MDGWLQKLRAKGALVTQAQFNGLLEWLERNVITRAGGLASVVRRGAPMIWVSPGQSSGGSTVYPFYPRPAVAEDPMDPPEDLAFRLTVGKGLVRGETVWVVNSNAGAEFVLEAEKDYVFYLAAEIDTDRELTGLEMDFDEEGDVPVSPTGNAVTGDPPAASYGVVFTISTDANGIDWDTLVHTQKNFVLAIIPRVVECDAQTLVAVWI